MNRFDQLLGCNSQNIAITKYTFIEREFACRDDSQAMTMQLLTTRQGLQRQIRFLLH